MIAAVDSALRPGRGTGPELGRGTIWAVDRLFQPFQRLAAERVSREGFGLGLSIVHAIAEMHGASITASPQPGGGLAIEVAFGVTSRGR